MRYYMVGGYIRDELLGVKSKDIDFAVEAESYEEMRDDILSKGMIIFQERPEFFAIRGRHPVYGGVDFTLCRKDGFYSDNRRPDTVKIGTIYDDLARRDFTINAIAKTEDGQYIDPHNGIRDIENKILRCVGQPYDRFTEDPLRILRAMRFHIVKGFWIHKDIEGVLDNGPLIGLLETLPAERIYDELKRCFEYDTSKTLRFLEKYYLIKNRIFTNRQLFLTPLIKTPAYVPEIVK